MDKKFRDLAKTMVTVMHDAPKKSTYAYDTQATVTRVDRDTTWVHIPGGVDETPTLSTLSATPGEQVMVRVSGGSAWISGNLTSPPTDDTKVNVLSNSFNSKAKNIAEEVVIENNPVVHEQPTVQNAIAGGVEYEHRRATVAGAAVRRVHQMGVPGSCVQGSCDVWIYQYSETEKPKNISVKWITKNGTEYTLASDRIIETTESIVYSYNGHFLDRPELTVVYYPITDRPSKFPWTIFVGAYWEAGNIPNVDCRASNILEFIVEYDV